MRDHQSYLFVLGINKVMKTLLFFDKLATFECGKFFLFAMHLSMMIIFVNIFDLNDILLLEQLSFKLQTIVLPTSCRFVKNAK